jgi:hypothetical protein
MAATIPQRRRSISETAEAAIDQGHGLIGANSVSGTHGHFMMDRTTGEMTYTSRIPFPQTTYDPAKIFSASQLMAQAGNFRVAAFQKKGEARDLKRRAAAIKTGYLMEAAQVEGMLGQYEERNIMEYLRADDVLGGESAPFHVPSRIKNGESSASLDVAAGKGKKLGEGDNISVPHPVPTQAVDGGPFTTEFNLWLAKGPSQPTTGKEILAEQRLAAQKHASASVMGSVGVTGARSLALHGLLDVIQLDHEALVCTIASYELEKLALEREVQAKQLDVHAGVRDKMIAKGKSSKEKVKSQAESQGEDTEDGESEVRERKPGVLRKMFSTP